MLFLGGICEYMYKYTEIQTFQTLFLAWNFNKPSLNPPPKKKCTDLAPFHTCKWRYELSLHDVKSIFSPRKSENLLDTVASFFLK